MTALLRKIGTRFAIMACVTVSVFAGSEPTENTVISKTGDAAGGLTITLELPKLSYRFGESIPLTVRLKNLGEKELRFRQSTPYTTYELVVKAEDGTEIPKTRFGEKQAWGAAFSKSFIRLAPGQEYSVSLPINRLFDMTLAGKYTIDVSKTIATQDGGKVKVSAPSLAITVVEN